MNEPHLRPPVASQAMAARSLSGWWVGGSLFSLLVLLSPSAPCVTAAQIELSPAKDTSIYQEDGTKSNGSGRYLFSGNTNRTFARRALVGFDLSGIPSDSQVEQVALEMTLTKTNSGDQDVALHRLLRDWGESSSDADRNEGNGAPAAAGDATWTHGVFEQTEWSTPGGDFTAEPSAVTTVGNVIGRVYEWESTAELVADVQTWVAQGDMSFGWIVIGNESARGTAKRFASRENPILGESPPRLRVDFTVGIDSLSAAVRDGLTDPVFDLNDDGQVNEQDRVFWVTDYKKTWFGDANLDGEFTTQDLLTVFQAGQYEDQTPGNSRWATGDWNGDADFDSSDLIRAFQDGGFEQGPRGSVAAVAEPSSLIPIGLLLFVPRRLGRGRRGPLTA